MSKALASWNAKNTWRSLSSSDLAESISEPPIGANAGSKFLFELKMIGSRSYMFAAETSAEQQQWMSALHRILHPGSAATERQAPPPPQNESSPAAYNESVQKCLSNVRKSSVLAFISFFKKYLHVQYLNIYLNVFIRSVYIKWNTRLLKYERQLLSTGSHIRASVFTCIKGTLTTPHCFYYHFRSRILN